VPPTPDAAPTSTRLTLPPQPPDPQRPGFPWLASIAPVAGSLALSAITGSPLALLFAALGPVVAVASLLDGRRQAKRMLRAARREREERLGALAVEIERRHGLERAAAWRRMPGARSISDGAAGPGWHESTLGPVVVGAGTIDSALRLDGVAADADDDRMVATAARLDGAPVLADPVEGIGFVGAEPLARAAARAAVIQCAHRAVPGSVAVGVPDHADWAWATRLPHHRGGGALLRVIDAAAPDADRESAAGVIAVASDRRLLPPGVRTVVQLGGPRSGTVERSAEGLPPEEVVPTVIGAAEAESWADGASRVARRAGLGAARPSLPTRIDLITLAQPVETRSRATLRAVVGVGDRGPVELDLVGGGPHAIVGGTTGSGKSEFLLAWLTALALVHPPDRVSFLLVDFKGGAAFEPIRSLPHVVGVVTDLDDAEAARAVASLRAELRHREGVLNSSGARDIAALADAVELARLVVVVDEFQAMIERFPDLGPVVADIAARGRSLGVHLVLAAQRPNGVVREQVTANCPIRVSLRVMHRADSVAAVGDDSAARIDPGTPGRGVLDPGDGRPVAFQSAIAEPGAVARADAAHPGSPRPRRPWLDPLPARVTVSELASAAGRGGAHPVPTAADWGDVLLGLSDEPDRQRREVAVWRPAVDGHLLVLGAPGSGRSALLAAVAEQAVARFGEHAVVRLSGPRSAVWDGLLASGGHDPTPGGDVGSQRLIVIDDLDGLFHGWPEEYRHAGVSALESMLRTGLRRGVTVVASATRLIGFGQAVRDGFGSSALLRHPTRADLVHAGGDATMFRIGDPPGAGQWHALRTQFAHARPPAPATRPGMPILSLDVADPVAVVAASTRSTAAAVAALRPDADTILLAPGSDAAARAAAALASAESRPRIVVVGDADAWAANWALAASMRDQAAVVVRGGLPEYRSLARTRELPPLLDDGDLQCWMTPPGGAVGRARWPSGEFD